MKPDKSYRDQITVYAMIKGGELMQQYLQDLKDGLQIYNFTIADLCRVIGVARSTFSRWCSKGPNEVEKIRIDRAYKKLTNEEVRSWR